MFDLFKKKLPSTILSSFFQMCCTVESSTLYSKINCLPFTVKAIRVCVYCLCQSMPKLLKFIYLSISTLNQATNIWCWSCGHQVGTLLHRCLVDLPTTPREGLTATPGIPGVPPSIFAPRVVQMEMREERRGEGDGPWLQCTSPDTR